MTNERTKRVTLNRLLLRTLLTPALALAASLCCLAQTQAPAQDATLERLREEFAMRYMEPEPNMALAKYFRDHGDRLEAFYILEDARRQRFEEIGRAHV